jgi:iron complex transport system substrate-binding protein
MKNRTACLLALCLLLVVSPSRAAEKEPTPVATLCPFVTDALANSPGDVRIVASVRRSPNAPVPAGVSDLGNPHTPNFELLAASGAKIVVADRAMHAPLVGRLEAQGLDVVLVDTGSVDGTFASLLDVGRRVGAGEGYAHAVADARTSLDRVKPQRPERVLALLGMPTSFFVMTNRSWQGDLLTRIGFENVAADAVGEERIPGFVPLSDEILAGLAPERVLLVAHGDPAAVRAAFERRIEDRGLWRSTSTNALPRIEILPPDRFLSNPGIALPEVAQGLVGKETPPAVAAP